MNIGILGTGFGSYHICVYSKIDQTQSIKVWGRNDKKLNKLSSDFNAQTTKNMDDIITDKNIDLIDICLPSDLHKKYAILAMQNGKDVFIETPLSLNIEDAYAIREASKKYNKKAFVDMFIRCEEAYEYIYKLINEKTLGKLKFISASRNTPHFWGDLGLSKIATKLMIHEFDFITWLLDKPYTIDAVGNSKNDEESNVNIIFNTNDTLAQIHSSSMMPYSHAFTTSFEAVFEN